MSGIDRELTPDPRTSLFDKHLPDTSQVQRLLRKEGKAHVFNDRATMDSVTQAILESGESSGVEDDDDYERYGLYFCRDKYIPCYPTHKTSPHKLMIGNL